MNKDKQQTTRPSRRKSDLPSLGNTSQEFENKIYTLEFKVNLVQITFEGLNNYAVTISCFDKDTEETESISSVLDIHLSEKNNNISIEGGPTEVFSVGTDTLDLSNMELDENIAEAVNSGLAWLKGEGQEKMIKNRRQIPTALLHDRMAMNLLMSSISTIIAGSMECHKRVINEKRHLFTQKNDYSDAMFDALRDELEELTVVAINRGVQHYVNSN
tara:strand:- start:213 stop:860 length:648 start_codon:yes stop_codon:yes gene_type:complete